ncbi:MAG TPA: cupin domain-containing protein [Xanthobacteraceae bacterium]|nr:cupin domain-containing protein [Xanthobacteraceae bacterium]
MKRHLLLGAAVALAFGAGLVTQSIVGAQAPAPPKDVIKEEPLVGGTADDMLMQVVTLQPNQTTPWHIHPDGHEISYVMEGAVKIQIDKQPDQIIKAGDGFHINANVVHRGVGEASGAKLLIVRLKPKDKPVATPVKHD